MRRRNRGLRPYRGLNLGIAARSSGAATIPATHAARFGAKTLTGSGGWQPVDTAGAPIPLTGYVSLVSGSLGAYVPSILSGTLRFTGGGAGAPAGATVRVAYAGGTLDVLIAPLVASTYSAATLAEGTAAYAASVLADFIELRAGNHNPTAARVIMQRANSPAGTWAGASDIRLGNYVVYMPEPGKVVTIGALEIAGSGNTHPRYLKLHGFEFKAPLTANGNGQGTGSVNGMIHMNGGSHVAITGPTKFWHGQAVTPTTVGAWRAINGLNTSNIWIDSALIDGCRHGIVGDFTNSIVNRVTVRNCLSDSYQWAKCTGLQWLDCQSNDKLYGYTELAITGITTGATTVITVADTSSVTVGEPMCFRDISGALGTFMNRRFVSASSKTATTVTVALNTTGQPAWDGVAGVAQAGAALHGDHGQFTDNPGADNLQNNVTILGFRASRGNPGTNWPGGQGLFSGNGGVNRTRTGWIIRGMMYNDTQVRAISIDNLVDALIECNTCVRAVGLDASVGAAVPTIFCVGTVAANNTVRDNIANAYTLGASVVSNLNNGTVTLVNDDADPVHPTTAANYTAAFVAPALVPNTFYEVNVAFATRLDAGGAWAGYAIKPGATPWYDHVTGIFTPPR